MCRSYLSQTPLKPRAVTCRAPDEKNGFVHRSDAAHDGCDWPVQCCRFLLDAPCAYLAHRTCVCGVAIKVWKVCRGAQSR